MRNRKTCRVQEAIGDGHNIRVALEASSGCACVAHLQHMQLLKGAIASSQIFTGATSRDERTMAIEVKQ